MQGDLYIGRGSRERHLLARVFGNPFEPYENMAAVVSTTPGLSLPGKPTVPWHAGIIITVCKKMFPDACDREDTTAAAAPSAEVLNRLARLWDEPESDDGSTAEEALARGAGWVGTGKPILIGSGYARRDICDGQSLASPGRWLVERRTYPEDETWRFVAGLYTNFWRRVGTPALLTSLALGKISERPFSPDSLQTLKHSVIRGLAV